MTVLDELAQRDQELRITAYKLSLDTKWIYYPHGGQGQKDASVILQEAETIYNWIKGCSKTR